MKMNSRLSASSEVGHPTETRSLSVNRGAGTHAGSSATIATHRSNRLALVGLTAPALLWFAGFMVGPLISMFYLSTLDWGGLLDQPTPVGLSNYTQFFTDPTFGDAVRNTVIQLGIVIPVMIPLAFMLGYSLSLRPRGHRLLSVIFFTPSLMSASARAMMFIGVYSPNGVINALLQGIGLTGLTRLWIADSATALPAIMAVELWSGIGFTAVVFAARLSSVPPELFEAANIDGASHWTRMWHIAYPLIRDFVGVIAMLQFLWLLLGSAQNILLLTQGGPGNASTTLGFMLYDEAFLSSHLGYSQAIGVVLFAVGLLGMLLIRKAFRPAY